jgi:threonine dehydrogenase-like Zn-dependent dehydrogenase
VQAVIWQGKRDVRVEEVPDPDIRKPDDVVLNP